MVAVGDVVRVVRGFNEGVVGVVETVTLRYGWTEVARIRIFDTDEPFVVRTAFLEQETL